MKNFGMLGKWHVHAEEYANRLNALPGCAVTRVWDADPEKAEAWANSLKAKASTLEEILTDPTIEGVCICTATNQHPEILQKAIESGKAVFTEKVLTLKTQEAEKIREAVKAYHTRFAISFPHYSEPATQFSVGAAKSGKLGKINYARVRKAHNGATGDWLPPHFYDPVACGGGAMIDLGAHPMYLLCELMNGLPDQVQSSFTHVTGKPVEDNAVSLLTFADGAIGVSETGFLSVHYPFTIEIGGTEGALLQRDEKVSWCAPETGNQWVEVQNLPEAKKQPVELWALAESPEEIDPLFGIDAAVRLTRVMEMAYGRGN